MATVQLSDTFVHDVYMSYSQLNAVESLAFWQSGIIANNSTLDGYARNGGTELVLPFWKDLDPDIEQNYSNDDPVDLATPNKVGSGTMKARKSFVNQGYSDMDLVVELTGSDPMQHIRSRFGTYWSRRLQRRLVAVANGVVADNIANDASDMGLDISAAGGAAAVFNGDAVIDTAYTLEESVDGIGAIVMHPKIEARAKKDDQIEYVLDSSGQLTIPTYKGLRVVRSAKGGTDLGGGVYRTFMFGSGAFGFGQQEGSLFGYGQGAPRNPVEIEREPRAGNGGGMETIWERKTWILHPFGFSWDDGTLVEFSPTDADLADATHWDRVVDREQVPFAFLDSRAGPAA